MKVRYKIFLIMVHTLKKMRRNMNKIMMMKNMIIKMNNMKVKIKIYKIKIINIMNKNMMKITNMKMNMNMNMNKNKKIIKMNKNMSKILNEKKIICNLFLATNSQKYLLILLHHLWKFWLLLSHFHQFF